MSTTTMVPARVTWHTYRRHALLEIDQAVCGADVTGPNADPFEDGSHIDVREWRMVWGDDPRVRAEMCLACDRVVRRREEGHVETMKPTGLDAAGRAEVAADLRRAAAIFGRAVSRLNGASVPCDGCGRAHPQNKREMKAHLELSGTQAKLVRWADTIDQWGDEQSADDRQRRQR